jgi:hypothetical protein
MFLGGRFLIHFETLFLGLFHFASQRESLTTPLDTVKFLHGLAEYTKTRVGIGFAFTITWEPFFLGD